jgi:hypothetical protein
MLAADRLGLRAQANVAFPGERLGGMLQRLSERLTAMAQASFPWAQVKMRVDVDDANGLLGRDVAEIVAIRRLVAAAENHGNCARLQDCPNYQAQRMLCLFQSSPNAHVPQIEGRPFEKVDVLRGIPCGQAV